MPCSYCAPLSARGVEADRCPPGMQLATILLSAHACHYDRMAPTAGVRVLKPCHTLAQRHDLARTRCGHAQRPQGGSASVSGVLVDSGGVMKVLWNVSDQQVTAARALSHRMNGSHQHNCQRCINVGSRHGAYRSYYTHTGARLEILTHNVDCP